MKNHLRPRVHAIDGHNPRQANRRLQPASSTRSQHRPFKRCLQPERRFRSIERDSLVQPRYTRRQKVKASPFQLASVASSQCSGLFLGLSYIASKKIHRILPYLVNSGLFWPLLAFIACFCVILRDFF